MTATSRDDQTDPLARFWRWVNTDRGQIARLIVAILASGLLLWMLPYDNGAAINALGVLIMSFPAVGVAGHILVRRLIRRRAGLAQ